MTARKTFLTTALLLTLALTGTTSFAEQPSGSITNLIVGKTNAIWDVSLFEGLQSPVVALAMSGKNATNYWKCLQDPAAPIPPVPGSTNTDPNANLLGVSYSAPYVQDGRGRLFGKGTNEMGLSYINKYWTGYWPDLYGYTNMLDLTNNPGTYVVTGSIRGVVGGGAILRYISRASCLLPLSPKSRRLSATDGVYVVMDATKGNMQESFSTAIAIASQQRMLFSSRGSDLIPDYLGDGTWTLVLNFDPASEKAPTRLSGSATVTLNSGAVYPFSFQGRYSSRTGKSSLLLKGVNNEVGLGKGATLAVMLADDQIVSLIGRVAGQVIRQK